MADEYTLDDCYFYLLQYLVQVPVTGFTLIDNDSYILYALAQTFGLEAKSFSQIQREIHSFIHIISSLTTANLINGWTVWLPEHFLISDILCSTERKIICHHFWCGSYESTHMKTRYQQATSKETYC